MADWHRTHGSGIDPRLLEILAEARARTNLPFEISSGIRTPEEQRKLLEQGYSTTMRSYHLPQQGTDLAAAADLYLGGDYKTNEEILNAYRPIAEAAKQIAAEKGYGNFTWGGDWKSFFDPYHFQLGGKSNPSMSLSTKDATMTPAAGTDVVDQMKKAPGGVRGILDFASERNPETGMSRFEQFASALDPLILPEMRAGQAIRATGERRVKAAKTNKTIEWLKNNGYAEIAAALEINPEGASNVMSAILASKTKANEQFRVATPEEAAKYGAEAGQFDSQGRFYPTQKVEKTQNLTQEQGRATGFYQRAATSHLTLNGLENEGTSLRNYVAGAVPLGNYLRTPEGQQYDQAKRDFINAILRQESGAVIGVDEFSNAEKQYFPQPGDSPEVIAQKRKNRENAIFALQVASGPGSEKVGGDTSGFSVTGKVGGKK